MTAAYVLPIPADPNWLPDIFEIGTTKAQSDEDWKVDVTNLLIRKVQDRHSLCGRRGKTEATCDGGPRRERHSVYACHDLLHAFCADRIAVDREDREADALIEAAKSTTRPNGTGRALRRMTFTVEAPIFGAGPPRCDRAEGRPGRRPCDSPCALCAVERPDGESRIAAIAEVEEMARDLLGRPGWLARLAESQPIPGRAAWRVDIIELDEVGVLAERDGDGTIRTRVIGAPSRDDAALGAEWKLRSAARGWIGTYAVEHEIRRSPPRDKPDGPSPMQQLLTRVHRAVIFEIDELWRAGKLTDDAARTEMRRLVMGRATKSRTEKILWRLRSASRWLGVLARHHDAVLERLRIPRVDEGKKRFWQRTSTWDVVERLDGGRVRVRDVVTRNERVIELNGSESTMSRFGRPVLRAARVRFMAVGTVTVPRWAPS